MNMVADSYPDHVFSASVIKLQDYILQDFTPAKLPERYLDVVFVDSPEIETIPDGLHGQLKCDELKFPFARSEVVTAAITGTRTLVSQKETEQECEIIELTLNVSKSLPHVAYQPGDTLGILASNSESDVDFVLLRCQLEAQKTKCCTVKLKSASVKSKKVPTHIAKFSTPREILQDCLNLRVTPKKQFLRALAECCSEPQEEKFLNSLSSKEGTLWYNRLILEQGNNFLDILALCPSCCPSLALLVEHLPRLLPRPYSIACSPLSHNDDIIKIIFSIRPKRPGVATYMMQRLAEGLLEEVGRKPFLNVYFRETNQFRYTYEDVCNDCILIGVGTGVAPFLGFLEYKMQSQKVHAPPGKTWLFSGAKTEHNAFGRKYFKEFKALGFLDAYHEAFSRLPNSPAKYVQDLLLANCEEFAELLMQSKTRLFVCADGAQISKSIEAGIKQCIMQHLSVDEAHADELITVFRKKGKYCEDLWS